MGKGGFDVSVGAHTRLDGAVIGSTAAADKNRLETGTLGFSDIENRADYKVEHQSAGISTGGSIGGQFAGNMANGLLVGANHSGSSSSKTKAAVSGGAIVIRDQSNQTQDVSGLNRDVEHANQTLSPIFDKEKEQNRLQEAQLIGEIGNQAADIVRTQGQIRATNAGKAELAAHDIKEPAKGASKAEWAKYNEKLTATDSYKAAQQQWGTGSAIQQGIQAATAAVQGLAGGNLAQAASGAAAPYLAEVIHAMTTTKDANGHDVVNVQANLMAHAVVGAVTAYAAGNSAVAGASGAAMGEYIAQQMYPGVKREDLTEDQRQTISTLGTLAAALAGGVTGDSTAGAVAGAQAGKNAVENNYLSTKQQAQKNKEIVECKTIACRAGVQAKWTAIDLGQDGSFAAGMIAGVPAGLYDAVEGIVKTASSPVETYEALKTLFNSGDVLGNVSDAVKQSYIDRIDRMEAEYQRAGVSGSFNAGVEGGKLVTDIAGLIAGGAGVVKGGAVLTEKVVAKVAGKAEVAVVNAGKATVINFPNEVIGEYSAIKPGPLSNDLAGTFSGGKYKEVILQQDTVLYRAGVSDKPFGQFFSSESPQGILQTRIDKAVLPQWPGGGASPIDSSIAIKIPAGTKVYVGEVGSQNGFYVGGTQQIVVPKPWTIKGAEIIEVKPLK